jgi:hypothetical protein
MKKTQLSEAIESLTYGAPNRSRSRPEASSCGFSYCVESLARVDLVVSAFLRAWWIRNAHGEQTTLPIARSAGNGTADGVLGAELSE